jgi:cell division protein ZapA
MKQVEVTILGQSYLLACPDDGQDALLQAVAMVDREMSAIRDAGKVKARERMAVLAALNLAYRLAEAQAAPQTPSGSSSAATTHDASGLPGASVDQENPELARSLESLDVQGLIRRLDEVLAEDGRLL